MHAMSLSDAWHHWRDHAAAKAAAARQAPTQSLPLAELEDEPERLGLRAVHWLPLVVPAMAVLLLVCASAIGSLLR